MVTIAVCLVAGRRGRLVPPRSLQIGEDFLPLATCNEPLSVVVALAPCSSMVPHWRRFVPRRDAFTVRLCTHPSGVAGSERGATRGVSRTK
jgi:hypothetical protein